MFSEFIGFLLLHLAPVGIGVCPIRDTIINWCQVSFLVICPFPPISHDSQTDENIFKIKLANSEGGVGVVVMRVSGDGVIGQILLHRLASNADQHIAAPASTLQEADLQFCAVSSPISNIY